MRSLFFTSLLIAFGLQAHAQIDPSSALLLNSSRTTPVRESGIDSGRYTVRPSRADTPRREERPVRVRSTNESSAAASASATASSSTSATQTTTVEVDQTTANANPVAPSEKSEGLEPNDVVLTPVVPNVAKPESTPAPAPTSASQPVVRSNPRIPYRQLTMLDLSVAPGYMYNDSTSSFTFRNYSLNSPVLSIDANVWFVPSFGLHAGFMGTSNAHVTDSLDHQRSVSVTEQWFLVGLRSRKFFGLTDLAPSLTFGIDYQEFQTRVPSDSLLRAKLSTTGPVLSMEAEIPSSATTSWILGATYAPKLKHKETSNDTDFRTGTGPGASSFGVSVGTRYRFDQTHSVFWKLSQSVEKNVFDGDTSIADPASGQIQHGVSVTNTMTLFQLGYTWAD